MFNPFELQAQLMQQWLSMAQAMTSASTSAFTAMSQQAASNWSVAFAQAMQPQLGPFAAFQASPGGAWPMAMPAGPAAFAFNPFALQQPMGWPPSPWPFAMGSNPWMAFGMMPQASFMTPFAAVGPMAWMNLWARGPMGFTAPWMPMSSPVRNPAQDLMEQAAATYRSVSGYAVAAVLGPLGTAVQPKSPGDAPWWQLPPPKRRDLN
jgi:hypothetical protein